MAYVLISLVDQNDEATVDSDLLARSLLKKRPTEKFHSGVAPDHAIVAKQADAAFGVGVLFGHNGKGSLRPTRDPAAVWADGLQVARMFNGGRIYVFACNTMGSEVADLLGQQAVDAGVRVFVGHAAAISAPDSRFAARPEFEEMQNCFLAMVQTFLDGCDDESLLRGSGWDAYDALDAGIGLGGDTGFDFWPTAVAVQQLIDSLSVLKKTD